ncbi:unnamed protein product [Dovyalis caffra]|uniref:Uncharacterized protein n=1 Tax=Dovyalis caffra TaxID=77055 RepID=A0AAV1QL58_9ROSI|nr:unnamed protein product [Dovyalis caffra]
MKGVSSRSTIEHYESLVSSKPRSNQDSTPTYRAHNAYPLTSGFRKSANERALEYTEPGNPSSLMALPEWDHSSWPAAYVTKGDRDPRVSGIYTKDEILELAAACRKKKRSPGEGSQTVIQELGHVTITKKSNASESQFRLAGQLEVEGDFQAISRRSWKAMRSSLYGEIGSKESLLCGERRFGLNQKEPIFKFLALEFELPERRGMAELLTLRDEGYAVAKEEGVEALPYLVSGDGSDPGPGLTTLRLIQYHLKTAIEDWKRVGNGTLQQEERTTKVEDRLVASPESDSVADTTDLPSSPFPSARWFRCCMVAIHHAPSFQCTSAALLLLGLALALKRWVAAWLSPNVPRTATFSAFAAPYHMMQSILNSIQPQQRRLTDNTTLNSRLLSSRFSGLAFLGTGTGKRLQNDHSYMEFDLWF